jgi:hypothetical protein
MDVVKTVALASRGYSLDGVPLEPTTFRKLLTEIKRATAAPVELKNALSHLGRKEEEKRNKEDAQNAAAAVVFKSMTETPGLRLSEAGRAYLLLVAGLGGPLSVDVREPLDGLVHKDYLPFVNPTWKGGPSVREIKMWAAVKNKKLESAGERVEKRGDAFETTLIRFSRPVEKKKTREESGLPKGETATRDLIDIFWIPYNVGVGKELEETVADVLEKESEAWIERQSRMILKKIKGYFSWPVERQNEKWIVLLDRIDVTVQAKVKEKRARLMPPPEEKKDDDLRKFIIRLWTIIDEYSSKEIGFYVAEETLCQLGLQPRLLLTAT